MCSGCLRVRCSTNPVAAGVWSRRARCFRSGSSVRPWAARPSFRRRTWSCPIGSIWLRSAGRPRVRRMLRERLDTGPGRESGSPFPRYPMLFEDLAFTLVSGRITGLCGPSGCGKSTLLSLLAGWEEPITGSITTEGVERVGWVFQNPYGVPGRSALDHVVLPLIARGQRRAPAEETALAVMADFRLDTLADRPFRQLSGGEAQRLMWARAVCASPDLLLVDEPTAQLDLRTAGTVNETLGAIARTGTIVVVATHDPHTRDACTDVIDLDTVVPGGGHG